MSLDSQIFRTRYRAIASAIATLLFLGGFLASNHDGPLRGRVVAASTPPDYATDVAPILQKNCVICHSRAAHKSGLVMDSYDALMKGGTHGPSIVPHDADGSRLIAMLEGTAQPRMPLDDDPLSAKEIAAIKAWINAGAIGPAANEAPAPVVFPSTPDIRPEVPVSSPVASVRFSPDGSVLAVGGYQDVRLVESASGKMLATLPGHTDYVRSMAFSPDGKRIAAAGGAPQLFGEIRIWDVQSHQLIKTMRGHKDCIYSIAWSPDGKTIASGSYDRMVKLWDPENGRELRNLQDHIDAVFAVAFSPDGKRLASASQDRTVKIWDVAGGKRLYTLSDASDGLTSLAWSPTGDRVAAAGYDKTIYIWRLAADDGHLAQSLISDQDSLLSLVWSPDGKIIATASTDGSIRFRDTKLDLLGVIDRQPDWVEALAISPDGKWLAAGRYNGSLSLYDVNTHKEARATATIFGSPQTVAGKGPVPSGR
jgi:WD40 repeat protein/mono/diheme cytochrome c family protein